MQPGTVPGAVLELHAAVAHKGALPADNADAETQFYDTSGNANHGTLTTFGFTTASGWAGSGTLANPHRLVFDGSSDYVVTSAFSQASNQWSVEAWLQVNSAPPAQRMPASHGSWNTRGWYFSLVNNLRLSMFINRAGSNVEISLTGNLVLGQLTHVVFVCDNVGLTGTWYVGGAGQTPVALGSAMVLPTSVALNVGTYNASASYNVAQSVPAFRYYPFALTPAQVAQNYAAGYLWPLSPAPVMQRPPITIEAAGTLARAKRRKDYCHVFTDFDLSQWYQSETDGASPGIQLDRSGHLKFACANGSVMPNGAWGELWYHLHGGLSTEQVIHSVALTWLSSGTMTWRLYEVALPILGCGWSLLGTDGGSTHATPESASFTCSAGMRGLALTCLYVSGKTLVADEYMRFTEVRVYGQSGDSTIADALTGILVGTGLADSYYSETVP